MQSLALKAEGRRHDLDWVRVLAFGILIFYHTGQYYVADWGWHLKSDQTSTFLQNLMLLTNPWRMSLLFIVSGCALSLACRRLTSWKLVKIRTVRLWIPLVVGMYIVVAPQVYFELIAKEGAEFSFVEFYTIYIDAQTTEFQDYQYGPAGLLTWNHLWYLQYLFAYTLVFVAIKPLLDRLKQQQTLISLSSPLILFVPMVIIGTINVQLAARYPQTNAFFGDWYNHALYFSMMIMGYLLGNHMSLWAKIVAKRSIWLGIALSTYSLVILHHHAYLDFMKDWPVYSGFIAYIGALHVWAWILMLLAYAAHWLNRPSPVLVYMNEAILPWYILHQTFIITLAFGLAKVDLPVGIEAGLILLGTFVGCALGYEIIKRVWLLRFAFGLKFGKSNHA